MPNAESHPNEVLIDKMDLRGNGQHFRFFVIGKGGAILTAKAKGNGANYEKGMKVPWADMVELKPANETQIGRYKGNRGTGNIDASLL